MHTLTLPSPAKINLMLHINGQRDDGYHLLQTVFQLLDYGDQLTFKRRNDAELTLSPAIPDVNHDDNLIIRAARLLQNHQTKARSQGVDIQLEKILPMGGGIGGGSSNAATTLLALNHLWQLGLSKRQLAELGLQLGADVPVFVEGHSAWAEGVGERLQAIDIVETWYLLVKPQCHVSTAQIFSHKQLTRNTTPITIAAFFEQGGSNDCQAVVRQLYPEVDSALKWLEQHAQKVSLTGTGACVFAGFPDQASAEAVLKKLPKQFQGFVAKGVNQSPTHKVLDKLTN